MYIKGSISSIILLPMQLPFNCCETVPFRNTVPRDETSIFVDVWLPYVIAVSIYLKKQEFLNIKILFLVIWIYRSQAWILFGIILPGSGFVHKNNEMGVISIIDSIARHISSNISTTLYTPIPALHSSCWMVPLNLFCLEMDPYVSGRKL